METISGLQKRLSSSQDGNRSMPFMGLALAEHFSNLFLEEDGRASFTGTPADLRMVLDHLLIIAGLLGIDAGVAVRRKYRNKCPRCLKKPCVCWDKTSAEKPVYERPRRLSTARSIWATQQMLDEVFPHRHTLTQEIQRVLDEMAELAEAFFYKERADQEEEIADVFAWLVRVASTLGIPLEGFIG